MRKTLSLVIVLFLATTAYAQINLNGIKDRLLDKAREKVKKVATTKASAAKADAPARVADGTIVLWVQKTYGNGENLLHTELSINGQVVNIYTSDTWEPIQQYLQEGWNTVTVDTTQQDPRDVQNGLDFRIGPVQNDSGGQERFTMAPVLWQFRNYSDWRPVNGRYQHDSGPNVRNVKLEFKFYWGGLEDEVRELDNGDFVLVGRPNYGNADPPITATVSINGHILNTFIAPERQIVISPYLKPGRNEIKVISTRVDQIVGKNDVEFSIAGPARWNATQAQYILKPVLQFKAMQGWARDDETGRLINPSSPKSDVVERVIPFMIKDTSAPAGR